MSADTIFALSSGRPPAAVSIIRVSGPAAHEAGRLLARKLPRARQAALRTLRDRTGAVLDAALVFVETARWFASDEEREPFAFRTICDALGLDADYLRKGLKSIRARAREARHAPTLH